MKTINIKTIRIDGGTQSRVEINNEIVTEYADAIKGGAEFPAVVVFNDGADSWLADGFHRFHAHSQAGKTSIAADVRTGSARDAVLYSLGANGAHGLNRTNADKRKAVQTMLADAEWAKWSDNAIAKACAVGYSLVSDVRKSIYPIRVDAPTARTVERNGKTYEQNIAKIGKADPLVQANRDAAKTAHEADIAKGGDGIAKPTLTVVETPKPEDEYTELDAAHDQIKDLQAELALANMGNASPKDRDQAKNLIAALRKEIKTLEATLKAVKTSRDTFQTENAALKAQITRQRREMDKITGKKTA